MHLKIAQTCEKNYDMRLQISACGRKNKATVEGAVEKNPAKKNCETADTSRTHKDAKLH